ncbi:glycosyltransferase family 4 protein [Vibrio marisflavi]|uniref:N-acetyl-alpha-D-glucosaminyl L-malate synthase n=1 Tax=Vibrio marisflavi CECT 7928 TaxID=634439 RepID=A0ABN8E1N7_9VIBR|nr:glycosyltransferase family 4 protein [Vibrio marisflavi]CAH0536151.1 N-acetyl-alpha-D-glucosaminyl L-malate synthase [Vibrio marisflavi CECT 7928]
MSKPQNVLLVHYGGNWIRGSERCLLDLVTSLDKTRFTPIIWTNSHCLHFELSKLGFHSKLNEFPILFGWTAPRWNISGWRALIRKARSYIRLHDIDLIHVNSAAPCQWMVPAAKKEGIPLVTQLHSDYPARDRLTLGLHHSPHIITVSKAISEHLLQDGYPSHNLSVVHNGVNISRLSDQKPIDVKQHLGLSDDQFVFATVGSLIHRKGLDRVFSALKHVLVEKPNTHLLVVGDGSLRNHLEHMTDYLRISRNVHFIGEQNNVFAWLKGCDGYVSGARREAFGLVFVEAALAKLPIVAPIEGGITEILTHEKNAILYKNSGIRPIYQAMERVLSERELSDEIAQNAQQHILDNYQISINTSKIERIYTSLLTNPSPVQSSWLRGLSPIKTYFVNRFAIGS